MQNDSSNNKSSNNDLNNISTQSHCNEINSISKNIFSHMHRNGKHYISCKCCIKFPELVKLYSRRSKIPNIADESGALFRVETVNHHINQQYHNECLKAMRLASLSSASAFQESQIGTSLIKSKQQLANKIGSLMYFVYGDAKKLTLSAFSYPMRVVVSRVSNNFEYNKSSNITNDAAQDMDFQYLTPASHKDILECIILSHRETFIETLLTKSLAMSLRCDGSVDRSQIDKIYVLLKVVSKNGETNQYFLGAGQVIKRGALGVLQAIESASLSTIGEKATDFVFKNISSIVTDGATVNSGEKGGLWTLFENKWRKTSDNNTPSIPFIKIWCAVHRSNLAWKDASSIIPEVQHFLEKLSGLSSFFHTSALRTRELEDIAKKNNCALLRLPKVFKIRWTEFTASLLNSVLTSWNALILYMDTSVETEAKGYSQFLKNEYELKFLAFMADVLTVFSRYQIIINTILKNREKQKKSDRKMRHFTQNQL
ncbi:E3 SUMO-protein ligase KIAA1586-like isoform X4 [Aphis craccivora]|uniref:E3 SUMO-protein ligase KIAA1586-like isoform X4 n=1 Tax=Aphis craccivora TaxID=307492 RepID=A0A6G0VYU1_APHCR|nr:E3 SUMO-protein ligase KIAA1586-like isoform X4 [Aphis craccivora]